ncbi:MAG TPA: Stk1 family PASTA domain-containing Ser/Thr kinase [Frankiaceae bacterium]|nr:Stk1 family PASTA domain-containing Ser/Thr kinase [Frankiaceae bacterium]
MDTSTADPLIGEVLDGRYRLDTRIARGGMATVYGGFDLRLDRQVAVKVMHASLADDEAFVERFRREAKSAARLSHPSVVAIYDQGEDAGRVYLVMEHVTGTTLRALLREHGRLSPAQALDIADGVLLALSAAHEAGLVHRDVKPENVLVTPNGTVKVADFGLARAIEATNHTVADGTLLGTVAYLAPEQVATGAADPRADLYALGVVLFEMLTGRVPYDGGTPLAVAYRHVNEDVPDAAEVEPSVPRVAANVVRAATRRDVDERYADAAAMLSAVRRARSALGSSDTAIVSLDDAPTLITRLPASDATAVLPAVPPKAPKTPKAAKPEGQPERMRRRGVVLAIVAAVVLLVSGVTGWVLARSGGGGGADAVAAPRLVGLSPEEATRVARDEGLQVTVGQPVNSDTVRSGLVAAQDPPEGTDLPEGATVTIRLSAGVRMVVVPDLRDKTEAEARTLLGRADLKPGAVTREFSETVAKDRVIRASQPGNARVAHGTAVSFVLSDGPPPVDVPNVVGKSVEEARAALRKIGLDPTVTLEFSDTVAKDAVIAQDPTGGRLPKGSTVKLRVSKGPQVVTVPDVRGERLEVAKRRLEALNLRVNVQHVRNGQGQVVLDQDPRGGTEVRVGSVVTLVLF